MTRVFWIYGLRDPRDGLFHYVGCTVQNPEHRLAEHVSLVQHVAYTVKDKWLRGLVLAGLSPEICPLVAATHAGVAGQIELQYINALREEGQPIKNESSRPYGAARYGVYPMPKFYSEGLRLLRERACVPGFKRAEFAQLVRVGDMAMGAWLHGKHRPGKRARVRIEERWGIPVDAWDREVAA